jgi:hypothetical protein
MHLMQKVVGKVRFLRCGMQLARRPYSVNCEKIREFNPLPGAAAMASPQGRLPPFAERCGARNTRVRVIGASTHRESICVMNGEPTVRADRA